MKSAKKGKVAEGVVRKDSFKITKKGRTEVKGESSGTPLVSSGKNSEVVQSTKVKLSAYSSASTVSFIICIGSELLQF